MRSDADENSHHPKASLATLLRVKNVDPPPFPAHILENPLQRNFVVREPLTLKCFPTFIAELSLEHRSEAQNRTDCTLRIAMVGIFAGGLLDDHWWQS